MLDAVDDDQLLGLVDFVDDSVHAATGRAQPGKLALQFSAESMRVVEECSEHELNNGGCGAFGESVQLTLCGTGHAEREGRFFAAHVAG